MGTAVLRREAAGLDEVPPRAPRPSKLVIEELRLERVSECTTRIRGWIHVRGQRAGVDEVWLLWFCSRGWCSRRSDITCT